jgi:hypothetical protein
VWNKRWRKQASIKKRVSNFNANKEYAAGIQKAAAVLGRT